MLNGRDLISSIFYPSYKNEVKDFYKVLFQESDLHINFIDEWIGNANVIQDIMFLNSNYCPDDGGAENNYWTSDCEVRKNELRYWCRYKPYDDKYWDYLICIDLNTLEITKRRVTVPYNGTILATDIDQEEIDGRN
jgi:hypothetical protein